MNWRTQNAASNNNSISGIFFLLLLFSFHIATNDILKLLFGRRYQIVICIIPITAPPLPSPQSCAEENEHLHLFFPRDLCEIKGPLYFRLFLELAVCPSSGRKERLVCIGRRRKRQRRRRSKNPRMGFLKMFYIFQKKPSACFCYISLLMQKTDEHCYGDIC